MLDLLSLQKHFILKHLTEGGVAVDYTMGNGNDTLFLSRTVGNTGRVFAFDVQNQALESTKKLLEENNAPKNYTFILDSHHNLKKYVNVPVNAGMFNLGWLPGSDKSVTTRLETTLPAIADAIDVLAPDGVIIVAVYPGHPEGEEEGKAISEYLSRLDKRKYTCAVFRIVNSPSSPYFFVIESK